MTLGGEVMQSDPVVRLADHLPMVDDMRSWLAGVPVPPRADILASWGRGFENYRRNWRRGDYESTMISFERTHVLYEVRQQWIKNYGFMIPCAELLDALATSKLVLEVGAGSGFMTQLMRNRGIAVIGTDAQMNHYAFTDGRWDVGQLPFTAKRAVRRCWRADTVFCSWPSYDHTWFRQMLRAMRIGQRLIVIREDATGDDTAWRYFDTSFEVTQEIEIPVFHHLHDIALVATKKRHGTCHSPWMDEIE